MRRPEDDPFEEDNRHAPPGFKLELQFFQGETRARALREALKELSYIYSRSVTEAEIRMAPGHIDETADDPSRFIPHGWMVFVPKDW